MDYNHQSEVSIGSNVELDESEVNSNRAEVDKLRSLCSEPQCDAVVRIDGSKEWIPKCSSDLKPVLGMRFNSLEDGVTFYKQYACAAGFNIRKYTSRKLRMKDVVKCQYFVCNKEGYRHCQPTNVGTDEEKSSTSRSRLITRVGCQARIALKYCSDDNGMYEVSVFEEGHKHPLFSSDFVKFQKEGRKMNILHKKMIVDNASVNIGPSKSFRIMKEYVGGYQNIGVSKQDFKNFQRDLKACIDGSDAQMFIDNLKRRKANWDSLFFDYEIDEDGSLCRVLWADDLCQRNYSLFGDTISFDTTFKTNRYNMIFGPFTGVDHHKGCVTFAASFIAKEDISSFEWVFSTFIRAMGGKEPTCLVTDQDPAMKIAIGNVFKEANHRFCMWHIMKKVPEKIGRTITQETKFLEKLCSFVWSEEIEPEEFETKWSCLMHEFGLANHDWLNHLYEIRGMWIPAYFRDVFLGGLMRTTSMSESENNFFTAFTNPHLTLVEFYMRFESSMDTQRYNQSKLDNDSDQKHAECHTPLEMEKFGAEVYTITIFHEFQVQLEIACFSCGIENMKKSNEVETYMLKHGNRLKTYEVVFIEATKETKCSCKIFERKGIPCSHMIWVWNSKKIKFIPKQYVLQRWCKDSFKKSMLDQDGNWLVDCGRIVDAKRLLNSLWSEIHSCVSLVQGNETHMLRFLKNLHDFRVELDSESTSSMNEGCSSKVRDIEMLIGSSIPKEVVIKPPKVSKNKGTGVHIKNGSKDKRLKTDREKIVERNQKTKRRCNGCNELSYHDIRNCPHRKAL